MADGDLELAEDSPLRKLMNGGHFAERLRNGLEAAVEAERHVPHLAREDHHDAGDFEPQFVPRKEGHQRQHQARQEAQDGNRLQHVEDRNHDRLGPAIMGGIRSVNEREGQRQEIGGKSTSQAQERVFGQRPEREVDDDLLMERGGHLPTHHQQGAEDRQEQRDEQHVGAERGRLFQRVADVPGIKTRQSHTGPDPLVVRGKVLVLSPSRCPR